MRNNIKRFLASIIIVTMMISSGIIGVSAETVNNGNQGDAFISIRTIALNMQSSTLWENNTLQMNAKITPANATYKALLWTSSDPSVATVDQKGRVIAHKPGEATITVEAQDGSNAKASCVVEVASVGGSSTGNSGGANTGSGSGSSTQNGGGSNTGSSTGNSGDSNTGNSTGSSGGGDAGSGSGTVIRIYFYRVTFDKNGGSRTSREMTTLIKDEALGILPTAERKGYQFQGWYTEPSGGTKIKKTTVLNVSTTVYAHWKKISKPAQVKLTSVKSKQAGQLTVKWKKVSEAAGYEVAYSTRKNFSSIKKGTVQTVGITLKNLDKKNYYVKVRSYKLDSAGEKVYGSYSKVVGVSTK